MHSSWRSNVKLTYTIIDESLGPGCFGFQRFFTIEEDGTISEVSVETLAGGMGAQGGPVWRPSEPLKKLTKLIEDTVKHLPKLDHSMLYSAYYMTEEINT